VPANSAVQDRAPGGFHGARHLDRLLRRQAALDEVQGGDAKHDDEVSACRGADVPHDFRREAHAPLKRPAPGIRALIARFPGELRRSGEVGDRLFDVRSAHPARNLRIDRRLQRRGRNDPFVKPVAPGMQKLQNDSPSRLVHRFRNRPMPFPIGFSRKLRPVRAKVSGVIGREAAGDDERRAAACAFGIERG
jgi:hypothetical protein